MWLNEELDNGYFPTAADFARRASAWADAQGAAGWWVALEWNQYDNASRGQAIKDAVHDKGGKFTIWLTRDFSVSGAYDALSDSGADGFIAEAEIPTELNDGRRNPQAVEWPALITALAPFPAQKAIVTNFAPFVHGRTDVPPEDPSYIGKPYPEIAAPLVSAGWRCLPEAYDLSGPAAGWPDSRNDYACRVLGWPATQPVLGTYGGRTVADFPSRVNYRNWSCWDAGTLF